ncbi:MAG: DUF3291 domain-containing protein [Acidimicrobiia bacterium]|nr:DUF3291 domain-containing protein [Acidimicrobiia bacterium]
MTEAHLVMWWVEAGRIPTISDATERLDLLRRSGPTPKAFTFAQTFPRPR